MFTWLAYNMFINLCPTSIFPRENKCSVGKHDNKLNPTSGFNPISKLLWYGWNSFGAFSSFIWQHQTKKEIRGKDLWLGKIMLRCQHSVSTKATAYNCLIYGLNKCLLNMHDSLSVSLFHCKLTEILDYLKESHPRVFQMLKILG